MKNFLRGYGVARGVGKSCFGDLGVCAWITCRVSVISQCKKGQSLVTRSLDAIHSDYPPKHATKECLEQRSPPFIKEAKPSWFITVSSCRRCVFSSSLPHYPHTRTANVNVKKLSFTLYSGERKLCWFTCQLFANGLEPATSFYHLCSFYQDSRNQGGSDNELRLLCALECYTRQVIALQDIKSTVSYCIDWTRDPSFMGFPSFLSSEVAILRTIVAFD